MEINPLAKNRPAVMTRRRKLLLWGGPAVVGLAVVAGLLVLALTSASEAERSLKEIQDGMTRDQVRTAIGMESATWQTGPVRVAWWCYPDGSNIDVIFNDSFQVVDKYEFGRSTLAWHQRIRAHLRKFGLPI